MYNPSDTAPYIGLRPFTEEDSLYFKGRDEQILQLTALLEANKFLMVTGASGDGKSSLVYAGLVPNARAGFFKARYTRWVIADFRPERSPVKNLSKTMARNLGFEKETAEIELRRGFSSLVELYRTSSLYVDEEGSDWKNASEDEKDTMQRKAANLLIVADQFEEFFTNPENYYRNSPSADSQLVINLLLETARISIAKDLPIYIVCTMRSDYIGQCAAFRGLPEFIGFSQFFVPRLKRKEMIQVVKEPASLHGDKISNRLVERVVYDLGEGVDQLPVLEHAMNEVWIQAGFGEEEMDLIHYAMAGGMPPNELTPEDQVKFNKWFQELPVKLQNTYKRLGLSHIIDTHANKLFYSAADHYNQSHDRKISNADAQLIIKTAFTCLTKMDDGRAVRNRMTLQEITDILNRPDLTSEIVGGVLNIFREPGNTFLRPYITDDPASQQLDTNSVLDITHESLIRNWALLLSWAQEEYDHLVIYQDFKKQLDRWVESQKSGGFLLPIGPLTFFEDWYTKLNPNKYWVFRYLDPGMDKETRLKEAQGIIDNATEFLHRSSKKVRVTRLIIKYGASRIAATAGFIIIIFLCAFYYRDAQLKKNENVVKKVVEEGSRYINDPRFDPLAKSDFMAMAEFIEPGRFKKIMDEVPFDQQSELVRHIYSTFMIHGGNPTLKTSCLMYEDSVVNALPIQENDPVFLMAYLKTLNMLVMTSSHYLYNHDDQQITNLRKNALEKTRKLFPSIFLQNFASGKMIMEEVNEGIENLLNNDILSDDEISASYNRRDRLRFNAGYQHLAYLYGSIGDITKVKYCLDSLLKYHPTYSQFRNGILNISTYLFNAGFTRETDDLLTYFAEKSKTNKKDLYEGWLDLAGELDHSLAVHIRYSGDYHDPNIELMSYEKVNQLFDQYFSFLVKEFKNPEDLHFHLALYFKQRGIILSKIDTDKHGKYQPNADSLFTLGLEHYRNVSDNYLSHSINIFHQDLTTGDRTWVQRRRADLFLYPDHFPKSPNYRINPSRYYSNAFTQFLLNSGFFNEVYRNSEDLDLFDEWVISYDWESRTNWDYRLLRNVTPLNEPFLRTLDSTLNNNPLTKELNTNRLKMVLIDEYIKNDNETSLDKVYQTLQIDRLKENYTWGSPITRQSIMFHVYKLIEYFALKGKKDEAIRLIRTLTNRPNFVRFYSLAPIKLIQSENAKYKEDIFVYLDSATTEFDRINDFLFFGLDPRNALVIAPTLIGGKVMNDLANRYVQSINLDAKGALMQNWILAAAMNGNYYHAYSLIPDISLVDRLFYFNGILSTEGLRRTQDANWRTYFDRYQNYWLWENTGFEADIL